jgi:hypothetical protein
MNLNERIADDMDVFVDTEAGFGVEAELEDGATIDGILDEEYAEALGIAGSAPVFLCRSADVAELTLLENDRLTIGGTVYEVANIEPDGTGMTKLVLERA